MMKKVIAMLLALTMVLSLAACGSKNDGKTTEAPQQSTESDKALADYPKASKFTAYVTNGGIDDEAFNAQPLANTIREKTGYDVTFIQLPKADVDTTVTNIFTNKRFCR